MKQTTNAEREQTGDEKQNTKKQPTINRQELQDPRSDTWKTKKEGATKIDQKTEERKIRGSLFTVFALFIVNGCVLWFFDVLAGVVCNQQLNRTRQDSEQEEKSAPRPRKRHRTNRTDPAILETQGL